MPEPVSSVVITESVILALINNTALRAELGFLRSAHGAVNVKKTGCCNRSRSPNFNNIANNIKMAIAHGADDVIAKIKRALKVNKLIVYLNTNNTKSRVER